MSSQKTMVPQWAGVSKPVIGMIHLKALPGSPQFHGDIRGLRDRCIADAEALVGGGVHGLMIENYGDSPFFPGRVPPHVVSHMTALATNLRRRWPDVPFGVNVLRNDGFAAMAVAQSVGAAFIRVNVLCGARVTDQGLIEGIAPELMRYRQQLGAEHLKVFADVDVKHSAPLAGGRGVRLEDEVRDLIERGLADAVIVSGAATGRPTDLDELLLARSAADATPVLVGSGVTASSLPQLSGHADGFIVGSALKFGGKADNAVDPTAVVHFMQAWRQVNG